MIVTGGENVYSGEVEAVIYNHPAVRVVAVFGIPDPQWGEIMMACIVLKPGMILSVNDLTSYCRQFLANYKIPRRVEFSDTELPKSGSGKILKRILRERYWAHEERAVSWETRTRLITRKTKSVCPLLAAILSGSIFARAVFEDDELKSELAIDRAAQESRGGSIGGSSCAESMSFNRSTKADEWEYPNGCVAISHAVNAHRIFS
jgi:hypothetical protein